MKPLDTKTSSNIEQDEMSVKDMILKLKEWFHYLLSKWVIILIAGIIGGIFGFVNAYSKKPLYIAELSFALENEHSSGAFGLASQFGFDLGSGDGGGAFSEDNLLELMRSRSMVEKTLLTTVSVKGKEQTLAEFYIDFSELGEAWDDNPELKGIRFLPYADRSEFSLQQDSVLGILYKSVVGNHLTVYKRDKKLSIINVKVISTNELFSKFFTEILTREVSDFYVDTKTKKSSENLAILQHQTDSVRRALNSAISGVASSVDANPNANAAQQILQVPSKRRQVDVQVNQAILNELVKNLEISKVSLRKETPLIQIIDKPILPLQKQGFGKLHGLVIGGFIGGIISLGFLVARRILREIMA